ncbi:hypothetical protein CRENBAI_000581 [Crenichthys baileyi]|uniref:Uncharacterized protein n=1 Tax=Crenichthys baileyi TaxID=28760 RepID=A0AAV9S8R8_9TELE
MDWQRFQVLPSLSTNNCLIYCKHQPPVTLQGYAGSPALAHTHTHCSCVGDEEPFPHREDT